MSYPSSSTSQSRRKRRMKAEACPECGSEKIVVSRQAGEMMCKDCGLIIDDGLIEIATTTKNAEHPHLATAGTLVDKGYRVKSGWIHSTREKNIKSGMSKIAVVASKLGLPDYVIKEARLIFKNAVERDLTIGRDKVTMAYASVYTACIIGGIPKTPLEVVSFTSITKTKLLRSVKILRTKLNLNLNPVDPEDLIPRFASRLDLQGTTVTKAAEIIQKARKKGIVAGRHPETIAAAAIYLAAQQTKDKRTQRQVANTTGVLEVTIRKRSKEIAKAV